MFPDSGLCLGLCKLPQFMHFLLFSFLCILLRFFPEVFSKYLLFTSFFSCWSAVYLQLPLICIPSFLSWVFFYNLTHPDSSKLKLLCSISLICHHGFLDHYLISDVKVLQLHFWLLNFKSVAKKRLKDSIFPLPSKTSRRPTLREITTFLNLFHCFFICHLLHLTYLCVTKNVINMTDCHNYENNIFVSLLLCQVSVSLSLTFFLNISWAQPLPKDQVHEGMFVVPSLFSSLIPKCPFSYSLFHCKLFPSQIPFLVPCAFSTSNNEILNITYLCGIGGFF